MYLDELKKELDMLTKQYVYLTTEISRLKKRIGELENVQKKKE